MVPMVLMALWGAFDFFLLAAGGVMIAFSILWKAPDVFRNLILTEMDLTGALPYLPRLRRLAYQLLALGYQFCSCHQINTLRPCLISLTLVAHMAPQSAWSLESSMP
jgi:hypothetical protein